MLLWSLLLALQQQTACLVEYLRNTLSSADPALWRAYQTGIGLGVGILTTLILFPAGKRQDIADDTDEADGSDESLLLLKSDVRAEQQPDAVGEANQTRPTSSSSSSPGHVRNPRPAAAARPRKHLRNNDETGYWTPHRRLNGAVYCIILTVTAVLLTHTYSSKSGQRNPVEHPSTLLKMLFRTYFPKESAVLLSRSSSNNNNNNNNLTPQTTKKKKKKKKKKSSNR